MPNDSQKHGDTAHIALLLLLLPVTRLQLLHAQDANNDGDSAGEEDDIDDADSDGAMTALSSALPR